MKTKPTEPNPETPPPPPRKNKLPIDAIIIREGHPLRVAPSKLENIGASLGDKYDPILVTIEGVLLDGRTRLEALRAIGKKVVCVRRIDLADVAVAARYACSDYLIKPVTKLGKLWRLRHIDAEYTLLHPEVRPVTERGGPGRGKKTVDRMATVSLAEYLAANGGPSGRTVRRHLEIARSLAPEVYALLGNSREGQHFSYLRRSAKFAAEVQVNIAQRVARGETTLRQAVVQHEWLMRNPAPAADQPGPEHEMVAGDFAAVAADYTAKVDLIISDVPWEGAMRRRFNEMAQKFFEMLRAGGVALIMVGQKWVLEAGNALVTAGFEYTWMAIYEHPRLECPPHDGAGICGEYPVLVVTKPGHPRINHEHRNAYREYRGVPGQPPHPQAKSVEAFERMILAYTRPGDLVCDLFAGSGTTAIAAYRTGRRFVGGDLDSGNVGAAKVAIGDLIFGCDVVDHDRLIWDQIVDVKIDKDTYDHLLILDDEVIDSERARAYLTHEPQEDASEAEAVEEGSKQAVDEAPHPAGGEGASAAHDEAAGPDTGGDSEVT